MMRIGKHLVRSLPSLIRPTTPRIPINLVSFHSLNKKPMSFFSSSEKGNGGNKQKGNSNSEKGNNGEPDGWKKRFDEMIKKLNILASKLYVTKFSPLKVLAISSMFWLMYRALQIQPKQITSQEFMNLLDTKSFDEVILVEEELLASKKSKIRKVEGILNSEKYFFYVASFDEILKKIQSNPDIKFRNEERIGWDYALHKIYLVFDTISLLAILGILISSQKNTKAGGGGGGMGGMMGGMTQKRFTVTTNTNIKFADVAGLHEVKREVQEIVDFLKSPKKYTDLGATIPKGVLLTGPPGTGKTLLAKACAGEAGVPFYSVSGSDFVEMFVGVGSERVRTLFAAAKGNDEPAIIFIDELDAIGKKRMNKMGGNDERQGTLNQLLVQMDGFETSNKVVVMGATNRKQILDDALVRPGRFDRQVEVGLPDLKGRYEIFLVHLKPLKLSKKYKMEDYAKRLAALSPGFSGAQIANLCNEAAILSARLEKESVEMIDFEISSERVIGGVERKGFVSLEEKKTVAFHECGHAVVSWFLEGADPLLKVTIIPRSKGALGFAQYFVNENQLQTKEQLLDRICFILGGRCSELHFFNEITTGAYDDLSKAYELAYTLITKYGMSDQIGYVAFPQSEYTKAYSEAIESKVDAQIHKIIKECTERTKMMVKKHEQDIKNLAEELLKKQTLDVRSIQEILGKRPFPPNKTFQAYLETSETIV